MLEDRLSNTYMQRNSSIYGLSAQAPNVQANLYPSIPSEYSGPSANVEGFYTGVSAAPHNIQQQNDQSYVNARSSVMINNGSNHSYALPNPNNERFDGRSDRAPATQVFPAYQQPPSTVYSDTSPHAPGKTSHEAIYPDHNRTTVVPPFSTHIHPSPSAAGQMHNHYATENSAPLYSATGSSPLSTRHTEASSNVPTPYSAPRMSSQVESTRSTSVISKPYVTDPALQRDNSLNMYAQNQRQTQIPSSSWQRPPEEASTSHYYDSSSFPEVPQHRPQQKVEEALIEL